MEAAQFDRALSVQDFVAARIRKVKSHVEQIVGSVSGPPEHVREYFCPSKGTLGMADATRRRLADWEY